MRGYPEGEPTSRVSISPNLRAGLVAHDLDIAFLLGPVSESRVTSVPLSRYPLGWVASPRLALPAEPVRLAELAHWPLMTYPRQTRPYLALREMLARAGVAKARCSKLVASTIVRMTPDGIGVSVIPPVGIAREIEAGQLRLVQVDAALPDLVFTASYPLTPDNRLAIAIAQLAAEVAREADRRAPEPKRRAARKPQRRRPPSRGKR
ncbi:MAG: substrate-binding domain-containing protein [Burkholderiales bacterium]|nr:substrate-binding domain-containing protein [Burkholderiales bacterium]